MKLDTGQFQKLTSDKTNWLNGRQLLPQTMTDPIAVSSTSADATVLGVVILVIIALVGAVVWRSRKKPAPTKK
jgi:hypothetical protein